MDPYHKIQTLFKRHKSGPKKGKMIRGEWTNPELEYLAGNRWEFTEKVDGTNIRIQFVRDGDRIRMLVGGRTDKAIIPQPLMAWLDEHFYDDEDRPRDFLRNWMIENELISVVLYGEGYGQNIQSGGNYGPQQKFVLFDVKVGDFWLTGERVTLVALSLSLERAPVLGWGTLHDAIEIVSSGLTWDSKGRLTQWGGNGVKGLKSQWGDFEAEGIVARPKVPLFDRQGRRIITKVKSVDFK